MSDRPVDHKAMFDQMPVTRFLIERSGENFVVREANYLAIEFFGKSREEIENHPIDDLFSKGNVKRMSESLKVCIEKKMAVTVPSLPSFPGNIQVPGFWINPVFNDADEIVWLDVIAQPSATDSSIVEKQRDDALLLLTSIFDVSEVGILVFDHNRRIVKVNDSFERIYGWNRKDTLGKDFVGFLIDEEQSAARKRYEAHIKGKERTSGEVSLLRKDGSIANTVYTSVSLALSHGRRFQVTTLVDITKHKQMEISLKFAKEQADAANHAKSAFLANMSHELRTPLNAIIGFSEMIMKETFGAIGNDKYTEYLSDIHLSARHLLEIINEVLDMSKIEAGKVDLDEQIVDLKALIESVVRIMASRGFSNGLEIRDIIERDLPCLYADPRLVRQVLINLVSNAVKYSNNGGGIDVEATTNEAGAVILKVKDYGVGIPADQLEEVMQPFGQIHDPAQSASYQGTGLGLPLARAMVELHGGELSLDSIENEGTTVLVSFPVERSRAGSKEKKLGALSSNDSMSGVEFIKSST